MKKEKKFALETIVKPEDLIEKELSIIRGGTNQPTCGTGIVACVPNGKASMAEPTTDRQISYSIYAF